MGNRCSGLLYHHQPTPKRRTPKPTPQSTKPIPPNSWSNRWTRTQSSSKWRRDNNADAITTPPLDDEQAAIIAAAVLRQGKGNGPGFDRSTSLKYPGAVPNGMTTKKGSLTRSSSTRPRSLTDPLLQPHHLLNQDAKLELETNHFVLIHGGGFGAWCWYKTIALLEAARFRVTALDLTGSGIHSSDRNGSTDLSQYVKPLTDFLQNLADGEKVILVGHDLGGACMSYAMELLSSKVSKAVYVAATMLISGQSAFDIYSQKDSSDDLMQWAQKFLFAKENDHPPTAADIDKSLLRDLFFNQSPGKDVALASVSMRPMPFSLVLEKLSLTEEKYGSVRRFYIETAEDNALQIPLQEEMVNASPPEKVYCLKGADHSPFFSKPQALHKLLVEIAYMK